MPNLMELKQERDAAWAGMNKSAPPSAANDWVRFALANAAWLKCYVKQHGSEPDADTTDIESSYYYQKFCLKQAPAEVVAAKTDDERNKVNQYRRDHKTSLVK